MDETSSLDPSQKTGPGMADRARDLLARAADLRRAAAAPLNAHLRDLLRSEAGKLEEPASDLQRACGRRD